MKKLRILLTLLGATLTGLVIGAEGPVNNGGLSSLRGISELDDTRKADALKRVIKDRAPIDRNYVHQPPVIPHQIRGYRVDLNSNKCLSLPRLEVCRGGGGHQDQPDPL